MDRLAALLTNFHLSASVFNAGALGVASRHPREEGVGYLHVLTQGAIYLRVQGANEQRFDKPVLILMTEQQDHDLGPAIGGAETLCGSFRFGTGNGGPIYQALPGLLVIPLDELGTLAGLLELMLQEARNDQCGRQAALDRLCEVLVIRLLRHLMDSGTMDSGLLAGLAHPKLVKALTAIHREPAVDWTLSGLAEVAGMSRARFAVVFRETLGQTPAVCLAQWRVSLAQALLRDGLPLDMVANKVGYGSGSALAKAFRRHLGCSPVRGTRMVVQGPPAAS